MPRPGPRPYECVRRAWHSDRHQPIRGSLIQEIFRVVNEIHNTATKKNKEWQDKLPVVVLKVEEIMYSKANSEAEYMDFKTVWDRANDAINTIIRREENNESGDLLQPCIEAALILGCTPRRASRSQRNSNPRCYLSPSHHEPTSNPPRIQENATHGGGSSSNLPHLHSGTPQILPYDAPIVRPTSLDSKSQLNLECNRPVIQDNNPTIHRECSFSSLNVPPSVSNQILSLQANPSSNLGRVYPLHYGALHQTAEPQFGFQTSQGLHINTAVVGTPQVQHNVGANTKGILQNLFSFEEPVNASNRITQADLRCTSENPLEMECDLQLTLGVGSTPVGTAGTSWRQGYEDIHSSSSQDGSKSSGPSLPTDKEFYFFPRSNTDDPLESSSSKWSSEGEGFNTESPSRKRKGPVGSSSEDVHLQSNFPPNLFFGRMKKPDI